MKDDDDDDGTHILRVDFQNEKLHPSKLSRKLARALKYLLLEVPPHIQTFHAFVLQDVPSDLTVDLMTDDDSFSVWLSTNVFCVLFDLLYRMKTRSTQRAALRTSRRKSTSNERR